MHTVWKVYLSVFQSIDIPGTGDFAAECHGQNIFFLNKEEPPHAK